MNNPLMKLADFLRDNAISDTAFAALIGKDRSLVTRYKAGSVVPSLGVLARIQEATNGQVTPADFFPTPTQESAA